MCTKCQNIIFTFRHSLSTFHLSLYTFRFSLFTFRQKDGNSFRFSPKFQIWCKCPKLLPTEKIEANPDQPRRHFDKDALAELTASVRERGVLQPLIVRESPNKSGVYQIVAGERRWRAAQQAQLHELPVVIRDYSDEEVLEIAIIENVQRSDLNPVDDGLV